MIELIEEGLGGRRHAPPAGPGAGAAPRQQAEPTFLAHHRGEHLVRPDMAEVQVGRQSAANIARGVARATEISGQPVAHEGGEPRPPGHRPAAHLGRRGVLRDRQGVEPAAAIAPRRDIRPSPFDAFGEVGPPAWHRPGERIAVGRGGEVCGERVLHLAAHRQRRRPGAARGAHRQQAVAVHRLQPHRQPRAGPFHHPREEERGEVVGHDHRRLGGQRLEQAAAVAGCGLRDRRSSGRPGDRTPARCPACRRARTGAGGADAHG